MNVLKTRAVMPLLTLLICISASIAPGEELEKHISAKLILNYSENDMRREMTSAAFFPDYGTAPDRPGPYRHTTEYSLPVNPYSTGTFYHSGLAGQDTPRPLVYELTRVPIHDASDLNSNSFSYSDFGIPDDVEGLVSLGAAFITNLAVHEFGHAIVADHVGASGSSVDFFSREGGQFFLGMSSVRNMEEKSVLPYTMGGEFFTDLTFEHALQDYRRNPGKFNKSLLFYSGTDFLWYCFFAFYLSEENAHYDPVTVSKETGISRDMLFSIVLAKTVINAFRIYTGKDIIIPYFSVDSDSASLNVMVPF